jgi:hypothetical protein
VATCEVRDIADAVLLTLVDKLFAEIAPLFRTLRLLIVIVAGAVLYHAAVSYCA